MKNREDIIKKVGIKVNSFEGELDLLIRSIADSFNGDIDDLEDFLIYKIENFSYSIPDSTTLIENILENYSYEIDDFLDNISDFILWEAHEKLSRMCLNLVFDISNFDVILSEECKKLNNEIYEHLNVFPSTSPKNRVFFKDYILSIVGFLKDNETFNFDLFDWIEEKKLRDLLKILILNFLESSCSSINNELIRIHEPYEHLAELILNVISQFNEINFLQTNNLPDLPNSLNSKFKFLEHNYDFFQKHKVPSLLELLSCTLSNLYIFNLKRKSLNRSEIVLGYLNELVGNYEPKNQIKSYRWKSENNKSLMQFYTKLIEQSLLNSDIEYSDFKKIFNGVSLKDIKKTLKLNITITDTILMVHHLMELNIIENEINWNWQRFRYSFNIESKPENLRSKKSDLIKKLIDDNDFKISRKSLKILQIIKSIS